MYCTLQIYKLTMAHVGYGMTRFELPSRECLIVPVAQGSISRNTGLEQDLNLLHTFR